MAFLKSRRLTPLFFTLIIILILGSVSFIKRMRQEKSLTIIGVMRASRLLPEEKTKLGLLESSFQVTDWPIKKPSNSQVYGYFLEASDPKFETYLGKCVEVKGKIKRGWKNVNKNKFNINKQYTYQRSAIIPESVVERESSTCDPYSVKATSAKTSLKKTYSGKLARENSGAPDTGYNYKLIFDKPINETWGSTGSQETSDIPLVPSNNPVWLGFEGNIGKRVTVVGHKTWGYAESEYLLVTQID